MHRPIGCDIDISSVKRSFANQFPASNLSPILLRFPDRLPVEELLGAVRSWLAILDSEAEK